VKEGVADSNSASAAVTGAIAQASQAIGASFNYLLATAQVESGLNPQAGASSSSARGLFQFIETTWLATIKQAGAALGFGRYADAITQTPSGNYEVRDPAMRSEILKLRNDPSANALMAGAFTKGNASALSERLGRAPSEGELYIAHFLGAGGGARLISLAGSNPNARAADYFPNAAQANPSIFYDRSTGAARSLAQVRNILTARYDVARGSTDAAAAIAQAVTGAATATTGTDSTAAAAAPDTAGLATAFAAAIPERKVDDIQVFHGLFADDHRTVPLAPLVSALWSSPGGTMPSGAPAQKPQSSRMLDLFKDLPSSSS
jgi:transglycosylase-like protein with SLT domain